MNGAWGQGRKVMLFANTEWYLYNFRLALAMALREAGFAVLLVSPPGPYGDRLRELGFRWLPAPMARRSLNPISELRLLVWLARLMWKEQVSLVHGFTIKCAIYGSLAARVARVPARINAVAGMGYVFISQDTRARLLRPLVRLLLRLALGGPGTRLIVQNSDDRRFFVENRLVDERLVRLIPGSGVNCVRFAPRPKVAGDGSFTVLLASRLLWDKGLREYVDAVHILRAQGRPVRCLLAGLPDAGNPASVAESMVQAWVAGGLVEWLGHVDDMPGLLGAVDAAVLPSYREGLPKSLIEAAACGLPLVTTDVPGCSEVVTDGVNGLRVPVRDAKALATAIARLQDDPDLARRLGAAARQTVLDRFDEKIVLDDTLAVYRELLDCSE